MSLTDKKRTLRKPQLSKRCTDIRQKERRTYRPIMTLSGPGGPPLQLAQDGRGNHGAAAAPREGRRQEGRRMVAVDGARLDITGDDAA